MIFAMALIAAVAFVSCRRLDWKGVDAKIHHDFPKVQRITTAQLAEWEHEARRPPPTLLDVRTAPEFAVSHLRGARRIDPNASAAVIDLPKDQPIVTYCSVGYRSGAFAQKLEQAGYKNVVNLEGSIFQWANEGRPVYRDGQQVEKVHPYNKTWGLLLDQKLRADVPPAG